MKKEVEKIVNEFLYGFGICQKFGMKDIRFTMKLFLVPTFVFVALLFRPVKYHANIQRDAWLYFVGAVVCTLLAFAG